jgi:uncharacterized protein YkwD
MERGRATLRRWLALVLALALLSGCAGASSDVSSDEGSDATATDVADHRTAGGDTDRPRAEPDPPQQDDVAAETATTTADATTGGTGGTTTTAPGTPSTTAAPAPPPPSPPPTSPPTTAPPPPPPTTAPPPPPPSGPVHGTRNTGCEQYMYNQINAARGNVGRPALSFDTGIQYIAVDWSDEMSGSQTLRHNPSYGDQIVRHRNYRTAGENVGRGYEQGSLFQAFMNSPGHRANIESDAYSHVTVGCLTDSGGQLWVTQNFWGG